MPMVVETLSQMYFFVDIVDFEHLIDDSMQHHLQVVDVDLQTYLVSSYHIP